MNPLDHAGQIDGDGGQFCIAFSCFGEENQLVHQFGQTIHLFQNAFGPLIFSIDHFHGFGIDGNNGQRCFQFMAGVGDESFLVFHISHERCDGTVGEEGEDEDVEEEADEAKPQGVVHEGVDVCKFSGAVQNGNQGGAIGVGGFQKGVVRSISLQEAAVIGKGVSGFREGDRLFFGECGNIFDVQNQRISPAVHMKGKVADLMRKFRGIVCKVGAGKQEGEKGISLLAFRNFGGKHAAVLGNIVQRVDAAGAHCVVSHGIHQGQSACDDDEYRKGGQKDKTVTKVFDYIHVSSFSKMVKSPSFSPAISKVEPVADSFCRR